MMHLYRVTLKGMTTAIGTSVAHGASYVVAPDPTTAYETVRHSLAMMDIGCAKDRELDSVELLAENAPYPLCGTRLYLSEESTHDER